MGTSLSGCQAHGARTWLAASVKNQASWRLVESGPKSSPDSPNPRTPRGRALLSSWAGFYATHLVCQSASLWPSSQVSWACSQLCPSVSLVNRERSSPSTHLPTCLTREEKQCGLGAPEDTQRKERGGWHSMKRFQNSLPSLTPHSRVTGGGGVVGGGRVSRAPPTPVPQGLQFQPGRRAPSGDQTPSLDPPCPSPSSQSQRKTWAALSPPPATSLRGRRPGLERASSRGDWPQRLPRRIAVLPPSRDERFPGRNLLKALPRDPPHLVTH